MVQASSPAREPASLAEVVASASASLSASTATAEVVAVEGSRPRTCGRTWMRRSTIRPRRRRPPIGPLVAIGIPRTSAVVAIPIGPHGERDNRQSQHRTTGVNDHEPVLICVREKSGIDPTAIRPADHVTPSVSIQASHHRHGRSWRKPGHQRKTAIRPGTQIHRSRRHRHLRG